MDKSTGRLKAVAAYAKSVGIAADQLINAVLGGRLKPCPYAAAVNRCTYKNKNPADVWQGGIHKR